MLKNPSITGRILNPKDIKSHSKNMKKNPCLVLVLLLIISCFVEESNGAKRQGDALYKLFKARLYGSSKIDTSFHMGIDQMHEDKNGVDINYIIPSSASDRGSKEADRIERLPGQPQVKFTQYGGYVSVDKIAGRAYYYYFVEAQHSKESLPLLLWLNGGPGCSSLAYGAMQELGPFRVHSDGKTLYTNKFSWNNVANVIFLESPGGVGFSYSNSTSDYANAGDKNTAKDNYIFLVNWFERFPEYKGRDFYISGESYAGHYVPQLAHTILYHNKAAKPIINLKGVAMGNAAINDETDNIGMYDYFATHALTSPENGENIKKYCNFSPQFKKNQSRECLLATDKAENDTLYIDIYSIYAPLCHSPNILTANPKRASLAEFDPCSDYYVYAYLNRGEVQEAMHANITKLDHPWDLCSNVLGEWKDSTSTTLPLLQDLLSNGLRVLLYSGDTDGRVPVTSTQYSLNKMNLSTKIPWYAWAFDEEVGGYAQVYEGDLTFATVRGAGHEVPAYQPARSLALITYFLSGQPLPVAAF